MPFCKVDNQGRITLPSDWRKQSGVGPGATLHLVEEHGHLAIYTPQQAVQAAQALIRKHIDPSVDLVEELFKERRQEVEIEERELRESELLRQGR